MKALPAPDAATTPISFRSTLGLEKREVSTHAAAVYAQLAPFAHACPLLLNSALLPFVATTLEKGFEAFVAHESRVYERWVHDKSNRKVGVWEWRED